MQSEYREGKLREKLFGHAQLPGSHPARRWRGAFSGGASGTGVTGGEGARDAVEVTA